MTFLLSRRWVLFFVAVALLAFLAFRLGEWQFSRQQAREQTNSITARNLQADPRPVDDVLAVGEPVDAEEEWLRVQATGRYVDEETVIVRYQTREGQAGVDVVTPLVTGSGTALLVDRGWMPTGNTGGAGASGIDVPSPPDGEVTVTGWVRADATGDAAQVTERSTRAVSSQEIGPTLPFPVYRGFVDLDSQDPDAAEPLEQAEIPDLGEGPHFFYGLQWWFFAGLAVFGFGYLAWDEYRKTRRRAPRPAGGGEEPPAGDTEPVSPRTGTSAAARPRR